MLQILIFLLSFFHPYYVSVTELKHNSQTQTLEISCRINSDDLEIALKKLGNERLDILNPKSKAQVNELLSKYIPQHLSVSINGKVSGLNYVGYELENEATWCYFQISKVRSAKSIVILNDILFAEHPEQINMLHVTVNGKRQSTKLDNPQNKATFTF